MLPPTPQNPNTMRSKWDGPPPSPHPLAAPRRRMGSALPARHSAVLLIFALCSVLFGGILWSGGCERAPDEGPPHENAAPEPEPFPDAASYPQGRMAPPVEEAFHLIQAGRFDRARARIAPYLDEHPNDPMAHFVRGLADHVAHRHGRALPHFERSIELNPEYPPVHHFHGWCLYYLGKLDRSEQAFRRHLELDPAEGDSHYALGLLAFDDGRYERAESYFRSAIEYQEPLPHRRDGVANAYAKLGAMRLQEGELDQAVEYLELAIEYHPDHYPAYYQLSRATLLLGDPDRADEYLDRHDEIRARRHPEPDFGS